MSLDTCLLCQQVIRLCGHLLDRACDIAVTSPNPYSSPSLPRKDLDSGRNWLFSKHTLERPIVSLHCCQQHWGLRHRTLAGPITKMNLIKFLEYCPFLALILVLSLPAFGLSLLWTVHTLTIYFFLKVDLISCTYLWI